MDNERMTQKITSIPKPFRGLGVLLVDSDTTSLLHMASVLEDHSYRVTITELAEVALSILKERKDQFDVVIANFNMPEMDCFNFIKQVHNIINNIPIILMSLELKKDIVEKAMKKGVCFFLKKPISTKKLMNIWQHVYRTRKYKGLTNGDQEIESRIDKIEEEDKVRETNENKHFEDNGQVKNIDLLDNNVELSEVCKNWLLSVEPDEDFGDLKNKKVVDEESGLDWITLS